MKVSIIGAGYVGSHLGKALVKAGHQVMFSSRTPHSDEMLALVAACGAGAYAGSTTDTLAFSDVVAVALRWDAVPDAVKSAGDWSGKIVIDMTNRFGPLPQGSAGSAAQDLARLTGARVVKAFNIIGAEHYQNPIFSGQSATMLIAGDEVSAKEVVGRLASDIGFEVVDIGGLEFSSLLENLAALWVHLAFRGGLGREIAFKLLKR